MSGGLLSDIGNLWGKRNTSVGDLFHYSSGDLLHDLGHGAKAVLDSEGADISGVSPGRSHKWLTMPTLSERLSGGPKPKPKVNPWDDFAANVKRAALHTFLTDATTRQKALTWEQAYEQGITHVKPDPAHAQTVVYPGGTPAGAGGAGGAGAGAGAGSKRDTGGAGDTGSSFDLVGYLKGIMDGLPAKARKAALADVNAQVAAIRAQQQMLNNQAAERARQIQLASATAANYLTPVADQTLQAARQAAGDQAAFAGGYQGMIGDTAKAAAAKVASDLAAAGAPANTRTVSGIDTATQPQNLGNILYSLGGALPASTLEQNGLAASAFQRTLPAATIGGGKNQALATLAAGQTAADNLSPQIAAAKAQTSKLANSYLTAYQSSAQNQALLPALLAGKYDSLPLAKNPVTGQPTSTYIKFQNDQTRLQIAMDNSHTSFARYQATKAYQDSVLELRRAGVKAGALKKSTTDAAKAAAWVQNEIQGYTKGSGANATQIPPNTNFATLYNYIVNSWPSLAVGHGKPAYNIVASMLAPPLTAAQTGLPG